MNLQLNYICLVSTNINKLILDILFAVRPALPSNRWQGKQLMSQMQRKLTSLLSLLFYRPYRPSTMDSNPRPIVGKLQALSPLSLSFTFFHFPIPTHSKTFQRTSWAVWAGLAPSCIEYQHKLGQNSVAPKTCQDMARATTGHGTANLSQPQRRIFQLGEGFRRGRQMQ